MISSAEPTVSGAAANGAIPKVERNWNVNIQKRESFHKKVEFHTKQYFTALAEEISARFLFPPPVGLFPAPVPAPGPPHRCSAQITRFGGPPPNNYLLSQH